MENKNSKSIILKKNDIEGFSINEIDKDGKNIGLDYKPFGYSLDFEDSCSKKIN